MNRTNLFKAAPLLLLFAAFLALCACGSGCASKTAETQAAKTPEAAETAPASPDSSAPDTTPASPSPTPSPSPVPATAPVPTLPPYPESDAAFVRVQDYIPGIAVDLRYATAENFTGQVIYAFSDAWLRAGTVKKLALAEERLEEMGLRLKIWDAFRPVSAQFRLWEIYPDAAYVANPQTGFSSHSRGNTVDITLTATDGTPVEMPTGFDDFSALADRDYSDCTAEAAENARLLEQLMTDCGFKPYFGEWWHFSDETAYPVEEDFEPG